MFPRAPQAPQQTDATPAKPQGKPFRFDAKEVFNGGVEAAKAQMAADTFAHAAQNLVVSGAYNVISTLRGEAINAMANLANSQVKILCGVDSYEMRLADNGHMRIGKAQRDCFKEFSSGVARFQDCMKPHLAAYNQGGNRCSSTESLIQRLEYFTPRLQECVDQSIKRS